MLQLRICSSILGGDLQPKTPEMRVMNRKEASWIQGSRMAEMICKMHSYDWVGQVARTADLIEVLMIDRG